MAVVEVGGGHMTRGIVVILLLNWFSVRRWREYWKSGATRSDKNVD